MATIKSFTSLEQSKKLAEILPIDSADMRIGNYVGKSGKVDGTNVHYYSKDESFGAPEIIYAWGLAALFSVLPKYIGNYSKCLYYDGGSYYCGYMDDGDFMLTIEETEADNPVDACVAMIEKLHELNLL